MDNIFGVALTDILIALALLVTLIFGFLGWIWWRNPLLVRMGLRNVLRRKTQTVLIVIGLMLSTLIISAAFATGDTVGYSISNQVYREFSRADVIVGLDILKAPAGVTELREADLEGLRDGLAGGPDFEAAAGVVMTRVPAINTEDRRAEPRASLAAVDPAAIGSFGFLTSPDGEQLDPSLLGDDRVFIGQRLQDKTGLETGDRVTVFHRGGPVEFVVAGVVTDNALTSNIDRDDETAQVGGLVTSLEHWREITGETDRLDFIVLSAPGGVRESIESGKRLEERVEAYIESAGAPLRVTITKAEIAELADLIGSLFVTIFIVFGLFSIAAGILLIFLTFIMLAAERRSEMGMARAIGMKRMHLTESFVAEGMAYNLGSALVGASLGIGVAAVMVWIMGEIFSEFGFDITFHVNPEGFVVAYLMGVVITFATVAFSSWRAANLNIVGAIRDMPDPVVVKREDRTIGRLARSIIAVVWTLAWIGLVAVWAVFGFTFFVFGLATYGLATIGGGLIAGAYVWGLLKVGRRESRSLLQKLGLLLWWIGFNIMALATWILFRTREWAARYRTAGGWAVWMLIIGVLATSWGGWVSGSAFAYTGGTTMLLFSFAMLAVFFGVPARPAYTVASLAILWWWLLPLPFSLFVDDASGFLTDPIGELVGLLGFGAPDDIVGDIEMFFISGVAMTSAATLFVIYNVDRVLGGVNRLSNVLGGIAPAMRMAISYPLSARFRTAMTLAMFGLVMFSLVVMATINANFTQLFLGDDAKGGFDVRVVANPSNRIEDLRESLADSGLAADGRVAGVGSLVTEDALMRPSGTDDDFERYRLQGADDEFLQLAQIVLAARANGYESDEAVLEALRTDPTLAIADESVTAPPNPFDPDASDFKLGPVTSDLRDKPWDPIPVTIRDQATGEEIEVRIIGIMEPRVTSVISQWRAVIVQRSVVEAHFGGGETESFYLTTPGSSVDAALDVASTIEAALLQQGVVATSIQDTIDRATAQEDAFSYLFEGFMGLGLIVGIAALGVIAFRTVAERRQQIGMMRAIGYTRRLISLTFFLESSFIALTGIAIGVFLGTALSYNLFTEFFTEEFGEFDFRLPWLRLLIIVGIAYGASAIMSIIPARSASRVPVAEALRYAG